MPLKLPKIIGHKGGASGYAPENTLDSIHTAADMDVKWVAVNVKLTQDQVPVLFHDEDLERTTNGSGKIAEITYEDLKQLEAGSWYSDSFTGIKIPTLEEAVDVLIAHNLGLNLEITPCPGREKETAEAALDILSQIWDDHDKLLISSTSHVSLETAQDMASDWSRGLILPEEWPENWKDMLSYLDVEAVSVESNSIQREQIESLIDLEQPILAYSANDPMRIRLLQSWGVDTFLTGIPDVIEENLLTVH